MTWDFLKQNYFLLVYGLSFLMSLKSYRHYFDRPLRFFPMILAYTFFNELLGTLVTYSQDFQLVFSTQDHFRTSIIYNVYHLIFFAYFYWVIIQTFKPHLKHNWLYTSLGILFLANIINPFYQDYFIYSQVYAYITGAAVLLVLCAVYMADLIGRKNYSPKHNLLFWTVLGLFIFHLLYIPIKIYKEFFTSIYVLQLRNFHVFLVLAMHLLFCVGFARSRRNAYK